MKTFKVNYDCIHKIYIKLHGNNYVAVYNYNYVILCIYAKFLTILGALTRKNQTYIQSLFISPNHFSIYLSHYLTKIKG